MRITMLAPGIAILLVFLAGCGDQSKSVDSGPDLMADSESPVAVEIVIGQGLQSNGSSISLGQDLEAAKLLYGEPDQILQLSSEMRLAHYGAQGVSMLLRPDSKVSAIYLYQPFSGTGPDGIAIGVARGAVEEALGVGEENPFDGTVHYPAGLSVSYAENNLTAIHIVQSTGK
jgi:hypothetical protein